MYFVNGLLRTGKGVTKKLLLLMAAVISGLALGAYEQTVSRDPSSTNIPAATNGSITVYTNATGLLDLEFIRVETE